MTEDGRGVTFVCRRRVSQIRGGLCFSAGGNQTVPCTYFGSRRTFSTDPTQIYRCTYACPPYGYFYIVPSFLRRFLAWLGGLSFLFLRHSCQQLRFGEFSKGCSISFWYPREYRIYFRVSVNASSIYSRNGVEKFSSIEIPRCIGGGGLNESALRFVLYSIY